MARRQRMEGSRETKTPEKREDLTPPPLQRPHLPARKPSHPPLNGAIRLELSCFILFVRAFIQVKLLDFIFPALLATLGPRGIKGYPEP